MKDINTNNVPDAYNEGSLITVVKLPQTEKVFNTNNHKVIEVSHVILKPVNWRYSRITTVDVNKGFFLVFAGKMCEDGSAHIINFKSLRLIIKTAPHNIVGVARGGHNTMSYDKDSLIEWFQGVN
jgi:hypothetical protein